MKVACIPLLADVFQGREKLVVLAPHPDDESLGCGALLARAFSGAGAHVICLTDGSASHPGSVEWPQQRLARQRRAEITEAIGCLGGNACDLTWLGMTDACLYCVDTEVGADALEQVISDLNVRHIFVPAIEDHHEDHQATARFAGALRDRRREWSFYSYPVWSRWDDVDFGQRIARHGPTYIPSYAQGAKKRAAINAHQTQLGHVIQDDPAGFTLPHGFVEEFATEDEIFWRMP